jgi:hypothetical protein
MVGKIPKELQDQIGRPGAGVADKEQRRMRLDIKVFVDHGALPVAGHRSRRHDSDSRQ